MGGISLRSSCWSNGSKGASTGANRAIAKTAPKIRPPPNNPQWRKMRQRRSAPGEGAKISAAAGRPATGSAVSAISRHPQAWVEEGVEQVRRQCQGDVDHGQHQHDGLDGREVLALDGLPGEIAESIDLEDRLDDDG